MEEEKAAAYYDELTRKGEGAARFKQGLGFSSGNDPVPSKSSSSSSFLNNFVKASSPPPQASNQENQAQLETIQNKLKKKSGDDKPSRSQRSGRESSHRHHRSRSRERDDRKGVRYSSKRSRSRSRSRERRRNVERDRRRRRSRSWSPRRERRSERRRSLSPRRRSKRDTEKEGKERNGGVDYSRLIDGYDKMVCKLHRCNAVWQISFFTCTDPTFMRLRICSFSTTRAEWDLL